MICSICPKKCKIDRNNEFGFCGVGEKTIVARAAMHFWEEPCISGDKGSGTVFFSGCNLKCKFCQNYKISQENFGKEVSIERIGEIFIELQNKGAHNINLVNPSHFIINIRKALEKIKLNIPVVYNTNAFETVEGLKLMKGLVNIYLPDLKYVSKDVSLLYSDAAEYFEYASAAILEMYKQVGNVVFDSSGIMQQGMIIRHLILPGLTKEAIKVLDWIKENLPEDIHISIMSQYVPYYKAEEYPEINRRITRWEYDRVLNHFHKLGFKNGFIQDRNSANEEYIPEFTLESI